MGWRQWRWTKNGYFRGKMQMTNEGSDVKDGEEKYKAKMVPGCLAAG